MAASIIDINRHREQKPILTGTRDGFRFAVYEGDKAPDALAAEYARLAYKMLSDFPAMLRQFDFARILTERNLVVFVSEGKKLRAAAYAVREYRLERPILFHKGYVSEGGGLARVMIAALHEAEGWPEADGEAVARIFRSGEINQASSSPFAAVGFHGVRNVWTKVERGDIHLAPFAVRQANGLWIGSHVMAGRGETIAARAREILLNWTLN